MTFNFYIGSTRGEVYGLECHPRRFAANDWLRPQTPIENLFLSGQDVTTLGLTGALMGGVLSPMSILGYGNWKDILSGRNLVEDVMHLTSQEEAESKRN